MSVVTRTAAIAVLALLAAASQACWAAEPSVIIGTGIDSATFRPGHPASPRWVIVRAGHEHPGVLAARAAGKPAIDPNAFTVLPPASVRWTVAAEPAARVAGSLR